MESEKRIEYIDLMKGICIILVVMNHCGAMCDLRPELSIINVLFAGSMPLYFLLSGLFFKRYGSFGTFFWHKFRLLVIPILVFAPLGGLFMQTVPWTQWSLENIMRPAQWVAYLTTYTNLPLWFLRALFIGSLIMYGLHRLCERGVRGIAAAAIVCVTASALTVVFSVDMLPAMNDAAYKLVLRCGVFNALALLPFLLAGHVAIRLGVLTLNRRNRRTIWMAAVLALFSGVACAVIDPGDVSWYYLVFDTSVPSLVLCPVLTVVFIWSVSFLLQRVPYVNYMGRYSLVVLVTHYPLVTALRGYGISPWPAFLIVLAVMPAVIWLCVRYIPWACARSYNKPLKNGIREAY